MAYRFFLFYSTKCDTKLGSTATDNDRNLFILAAETYTPSSSVATYNPAQSKVSPRRPSTSQQRERKNSGSISSSPSNTRHHKPAPIRRRLSTQELTKEPVVIPLIAKQTGTQSMHSAHPDPRLTLSRLTGNNHKSTRFTASMPKFSKDLILPNSSQMLNMTVTLSNEDKSTKRDPRLGRQKDPRLQRSVDPRLKTRNVLKSSTNNTVSATTEPKSSSVPSKPSALLTKSSTSIPSLPELDLNLAYVQQVSKENDTNHVTNTSKSSTSSYSLPTLKLPKLVKAPTLTNSPVRDTAPEEPILKEPTIAPYDPRYMSSASSATTTTGNVTGFCIFLEAF